MATFLDQLRADLRAYSGPCPEVVTRLPELFSTLCNLLDDPRTTGASRLVAAAGLGYLMLPFDALPDEEIEGRCDDAYVAAYACRYVADRQGAELVDDAAPEEGLAGELEGWLVALETTLGSRAAGVLAHVGLDGAATL